MIFAPDNTPGLSPPPGRCRLCSELLVPSTPCGRGNSARESRTVQRGRPAHPVQRVHVIGRGRLSPQVAAHTLALGFRWGNSEFGRLFDLRAGQMSFPACLSDIVDKESHVMARSAAKKLASHPLNARLVYEQLFFAYQQAVRPMPKG